MNCDLFGDPVIQLTKEKKASVYYVAISGIQKAVRRVVRATLFLLRCLNKYVCRER